MRRLLPILALLLLIPSITHADKPRIRNNVIICVDGAGRFDQHLFAGHTYKWITRCDKEDVLGKTWLWAPGHPYQMEALSVAEIGVRVCVSTYTCRRTGVYHLVIGTYEAYPVRVLREDRLTPK
jgi:hypothetical protein